MADAIFGCCVATALAPVGGVPGVDLDPGAPSVFRFGAQYRDELAPASVTDRSVEPGLRPGTIGEELTGVVRITVALAESFQIDRTIDRFRGAPYLTALRFTRELRLLDLAADSAGSWPTRAGGTFTVSTGPHSITQRWARRIAEAFPDVDGVLYNSRFSGRHCVALFAPAVTAVPPRPVLSLPLSHPGLAVRIASAARQLGYQLI
ncbi:MAG: RES family NAD+ phosphorylase [Mycobacterium sp.]